MRQGHINKSNRRGAALVEMALVLPVLFLFLFGIVELGFALWTYNTLTYVTREGARFASVHSVDTQAEANTTQFIINNGIGLKLDPSNITLTWTPDKNRGSTVTVQVTTSYLPVSGYIPGITMRSTTSMIVSR